MARQRWLVIASVMALAAASYWLGGMPCSPARIITAKNGKPCQVRVAITA